MTRYQGISFGQCGCNLGSFPGVLTSHTPGKGCSTGALLARGGGELSVTGERLQIEGHRSPYIFWILLCQMIRHVSILILLVVSVTLVMILFSLRGCSKTPAIALQYTGITPKSRFLSQPLVALKRLWLGGCAAAQTRLGHQPRHRTSRDHLVCCWRSEAC